MKFLIKLFSVSFLICAVLYVFSGVASRAQKEENRSLTYLAVGFDSSPANTDVLCLVSYDSRANTVSAIQIPRDTAIKYGNDYLKINSYYSRKISEGATHRLALEELCDEISSLLGVEIDGYAAITTDGLVSLVDFLGGIYIAEKDVPMQLEGIFEAKEGEVFLSGNDALRFVRYRENYTRGDLQRLDAQKIFVRSLANRISERRELFSLLKFAADCDGITIDVDKGRSLSFLLSNAYRLDDTDLQIATLPGEATKYGDTWYYTVDKERSMALISGYFPHYRNSFDKNGTFVYQF